MRSCPVQLNAVHKYSRPIESQWQKLKQRQREGKRKTERERWRGCLHGMPSFLPSCLWGSERVAHSTGEQLVRRGREGTGWVGEHLNIDSFRSDAIWWCEQSIFFLDYCSVETVCTNTVLGHESCMSDGLCHVQKDKWDLFHFNHLWLIVDCAADAWESTQYCYKKLISIPSKFSYLTNCLRRMSQNHQLGNKIKMLLHHYLS